MFFLQIEKIGLDSVKECQIDHISQALGKQKSWFQNVFKSHNVELQLFKLKNEMQLKSKNWKWKNLVTGFTV